MAHGLANLIGRPQHVEDVVDDLEGHAYMAAVVFQGLHFGFGCTAEEGAGLGGGREEGRRLTIYPVAVVFFFLLPVVGVEVLQQLAAGKLHDGLGEAPDGTDIPGVAHEGG